MTPQKISLPHYPDHAARVQESLTTWYETSVDTFREDNSLLFEYFQAVLLQGESAPEQVLLDGIPLSLASPYIRSGFIRECHLLDSTKIEADFIVWFNTELFGEHNIDTQERIEQTAQRHLFDWLDTVDESLKGRMYIWDTVDSDIRNYLITDAQTLHPISDALLTNLQKAIIEQFITDTYLPPYLLGTEKQL
jgi:hypothetical protein